MKKNYSIVSLVQTIIMVLAVLFPVIVSSQELTYAQKEERCQNNTNRIAELETELRIINADLSQSMEKKEMQDAVDKLKFIREVQRGIFISVEDKARDIARVERIAAQYNYNFTACREEDCFFPLIRLIEKMEKALSVEKLRPALINKKNEIDKQLASHKNNLIALGCNQSAGTLVNNIDPSKLEGSWEKDKELAIQHFRFPVEFFTVSKNSITGRSGKFSELNYAKITGGSYDETTKVLSFMYVRTQDKKTGTAKLLLTETATEYKLRGTWKHDDGSDSGGLMMAIRK